jgi:hypothetical protein
VGRHHAVLRTSRIADGGHENVALGREQLKQFALKRMVRERLPREVIEVDGRRVSSDDDHGQADRQIKNGVRGPILTKTLVKRRPAGQDPRVRAPPLFQST